MLTARSRSLILTLICSAVVVTGCSSSKQETKIDPATLKSQSHTWSLEFASGGGVTGIYNGYMIKSNGEATAWRNKTDNELAKTTLSLDVIEYIYDQLELTKFRSITTNAPSNMTTYITLREGDSVYTVKWGDIKTPPPESMPILYGTLVTFLHDRLGK